MIAEKDMEDAVAADPEKFIGEHGLKLTARQYRIDNYRFDLLFEDRHGGKLIVELQKGTLDRNHTYKILDYYDAYKEKRPNEFIDLMVIANKITRERRVRLQSYGIEFKEIPLSDFQDFADSQHDEKLENNIQNNEFAKSDLNIEINQNKRMRDHSQGYPWDHHESSDQGGKIDEMIKMGKSIEEIFVEFKKLYPDHRDPKGRVIRHIKHLLEEHGDFPYKAKFRKDIISSIKPFQFTENFQITFDKCDERIQELLIKLLTETILYSTGHYSTNKPDYRLKKEYVFCEYILMPQKSCIKINLRSDSLKLSSNLLTLNEINMDTSGKPGTNWVEFIIDDESQHLQETIRLVRETSEYTEIRPKANLQIFFKQLLKHSNAKIYIFKDKSPESVTNRTKFLGKNAGKKYLDWFYDSRGRRPSIGLSFWHNDGQVNQNRFQTLKEKKKEIEATFGESLDWEYKEGRKYQYLRSYTVIGELDDEDKWPQIQEEMVERMIRLEKTFSPYISELI